MTRFVGVSRAVAVLTLAVLAAVAPMASGACSGDGPECVLACYSGAHANRDIGALESLLAHDYMWVVVAQPRAELFNRETTLTATREMFADADVEQLGLEFEDGYLVAEGDEAGTWRLENIRVTLSIKHESVDEPHVATVCSTLYVRKVGPGGEGYEIYKEVTFEGTGCGQ